MIDQIIPFPNKRYNVILCDPPWVYRDPSKQGKRGAGFKYDLMSDDAIARLPVNEIADKDCFLFMWVTFPRLFAAEKIMNSWNFKYKTLAFNWVKTNKVQTKKLFMGMGAVGTRANSEICLLGTKGKPKRVSASVRSTVISPIREHSRKPDCVRARIIELCGDLPRIELFARQQTEGWDTWGIETHKL